VTDNGGATDSTSQSVTVSGGGGGGETLTPSSSNDGKTWTATVTSSASALSGSFDYGNGGSCGGNSCSLGGIPKKQGSVTFTEDGTGTQVVVTK
jgi:hypothetical protein